MNISNSLSNLEYVNARSSATSKNNSIVDEINLNKEKIKKKIFKNEKTINFTASI
jgi:hypothetical protein